MSRFLYSLLSLSLFSSAWALDSGTVCSLSQGTRSAFIENADLKAGTKALMWANTEVAAQRWRLELAEDGSWGLCNLYTGYYLGVNRLGAGAVADQRVYSKYLSRWNLEEVENGYRLVFAQNTDLCLAAASANEGAALTLVEKASAVPALSVFDLREDDTEIPSAFTAGVRDAVMDGFLGQYYHKASVGHVLGGGGWWGDAEMFETVLDAFATTGDLRYKEIFHELYTNFLQRNGSDWSGNSYNDDITWMVLACARAYQYFGVTDYLNKAKDNYTRMYNRAHQRFGTLIWNQNQDNKLGTNSCINCPATVAACYLGRLTGDKSWFTKAISIYAGQRKLLFNADTGEVWDSRAWKSDGTGEGDFNHWVSTYNQGTMLGAAVALYDHTKDPMYLEDARKVYERSRDHLTNSNKIVSVCQTINGDLCGFKGILMRYVRTYAESQRLEEPMLWLEKNAWHAWQNRNSRGVIWSAWLTKTAEDLRRMEGSDQKDVTNDAFGSSTAVSAAFNAHVNRKFAKSAAEGLEAADFDEIQFMQLDSILDDGATPNTTASAQGNGYICFRNVDFGEGGYEKAVLRLNTTGSRTYAKIYTDSITESTLLGRTTGFLSKQWQDATVEFAQPLTGRHDIFVEAKGIGMKFHNVSFEAGESAIDDLLADAEEAVITVKGNELCVECSEGADLFVCNPSGATEIKCALTAGTHLFPLPAGIHICRLSTSTRNFTRKITIE